MFLGYLLKINGEILPNKYIDIQTYEANPNRREVILKFKDGNMVDREQLSPHTTTYIAFNTNGMLYDDKDNFLRYFQNKSGLDVEYWNDEKGIYDCGKFKRNDFKFSMYKIRSNTILYKPLSVVLEEY